MDLIFLLSEKIFVTWFILANYVKAIMNRSEDCAFINHHVKKRFIRNNNVITASLTDGCENVSDAQIETANILLADEFYIEQIPEVVTNLPNYP